jgi:hypothetical protein
VIPRPRLFLGVLAVLALAALALGSIATSMPSGPAAIIGPGDRFSADRAFVHGQAVGKRVAQAHVRVMDGSDELDRQPGFVLRPAGVGGKGSYLSELVLITKTYDLA